MTIKKKEKLDPEYADEINNPDLRLYAKIEFGYSSTYILPYKDGIKLMGDLEGAMELDTSAYKSQKIIPIKNAPQFSLLTREQYVEYRMNALLDKDKDES